MDHLNFSWLIQGSVAGHSAPLSEADLRYLKQRGIKSLVCMVEFHRVRITGAQIAASGFIYCYEAVPDLTSPTKGQLDKLVAFIKKSVAENRPVGVSCGAGLGRTGTVLACYLVSLGYNSIEAINEVRVRRPGSIETKTQEEAVKMYAAR